METGVTLALNWVFGLLDRAIQISSLIKTAQANGVDITPAQLEQLQAADDVAKKNLQDAIDEAKLAGN